MKFPISAIALLTIVGTNAFTPQVSHTVSKVNKAPFLRNNFILGSSNINKDVDNSLVQDVVEGSLGLSYPPISLFGRGHDNKLSNLDTSQIKKILGGKGANLAEMSSIGLSVPPGFTISTECCDKFCNEWDQDIPTEIWNQILQSLTTIEDSMESKFGASDNPLLLSVRSGAAISMPGMMDTVLNLGMNDEVVEGLAKKSGNDRFAWDSYRRFLEMFGKISLMNFVYQFFKRKKLNFFNAYYFVVTSRKCCVRNPSFIF